MARYLLQRLILAVVTLFVIVLVSYVLLRLAPGDPTRSDIFGGDGSAAVQSGEHGAFARNASMAEALHLDKPILAGFGYWFGNLLRHGTFGESIIIEPGRPVSQVIAPRLAVTLKLNLLALLCTWALAIPAGVWAARRAGGPGDQISTVGLFLLYSLPGMWVALVLQALFCEGGWVSVFPLRGLVVEGGAAMGSWAYAWATFKAYVLPVLCLSYAGFAMLTRYVRGGMIEALHQDYIRTARAKGLDESTVVWKHAFRNALITLITLSAGVLPGLIAGSVIIEYVFNIPGMGALAIASLSSRDYPLQMAIFVISGALTLGGIMLADVLYTRADPRISFTKRR